MYLSSCNSNSSFSWKSFTSSWFETINSTKSCRYSYWSSRVRANWKSWGMCGNLRTLSSWWSTSNTFWIERIFSLSKDSIRTLDSQKSLWNVCMSISNTTLFLKQLNNFTTLGWFPNIFAETTSLNHTINF